MKLMPILLLLLGASLVLAANSPRVAQDCESDNEYWNTQTCLDCQKYCTCSTYKGCDTLTCPSGTSEFDYNNLKTCAPCPDGCTKCTIVPGQTKTLNGFTCTECITCDQTSDPNCQNDKNTYYQLIAGICVLLDKQSTTPTSTQLYFDVQSQTSKTINGDSMRCIEYDSSTGMCKTCPDGSFFNEYKNCEQCVTKCAKCNSRGTCQTCSSGYYWKPNQDTSQKGQPAPGLSYARGNGGCAPCANDYTLTCDPTGLQSITCISGAYVDSQKCVLCGANCITCTNSSTCTKCQDGYFLDSGKCTACPGNDSTKISCIACNTGKATSCDTCDTVYGYKMLFKQCQKCPVGCTDCSEVGTSISCTTCDNGYYKSIDANKVGSCIACTTLNAYAKLCYKDDTTVTEKPVITQCQDSYWLVQNTAGTGLTCKQGLGLNCNTMVDEGGKCKDCLPGTQLLSGLCVTCQSQSEGCTTCKIENDKFSCTACSNNNPSSTNYVLLTTTNLCSKCNDNCLTCNVDNTCKSCKDGYVLNNGACNKCVTSGCQTCQATNLNTCVTCVDGLYLFTDTDKTTYCYQCPYSCSKCGTNGQKCTECLPGYYLKGDGCSNIPLYCSVANSDGSCKECQYAFRKSEDGSCLPCIDFYGGYVCGENAGSECFGLIIKSLSFVMLLLAYLQ